VLGKLAVAFLFKTDQKVTANIGMGDLGTVCPDRLE
jgi:hypothetical protein